MQAQSVDIGQGMAWVGCGWRQFMKNPGLWVVIGILLIVITVVLSFVPLIGQLALALLAPVLGGGLAYAARESDEGRPMDIAHLFQGFREPGKLSPLLTLGGVALAFAIVAMIIMGVLVGGSMMTVAMLGGRPEEAVGVQVSFLLALLLVLAVQLLVAMALIYAMPLVMLRGVSPGEAMRSSFNACLANILPLLVFGVVYFVLALLASLPLLLGWFLLLPVSIGTWYCSYKSLFPAAAPAPA